MEIRATAGQVREYEGDAVVVGVMAASALSGPAAEADACLDGLLGRLVESGEIRGKTGEVRVVHSVGKMRAARVVVAGLGDVERADLFGVRRAMGAAARVLRDRRCRRVATTLHQAGVPSGLRRQGVRAVVEAVYQGLYAGAECKTGAPEHGEFDELCLLGIPDEQAEAVAAVVRSARIAGEATSYARRLVNLPANELTPTRLAEEAGEAAESAGLEVEVLGPTSLAQLGMGALLAVARGSEEPAQLIVLRNPGKESGRRVALVGKGLTFDSGGISIKRADDMHLMKNDMAGAAAVLAATRAIGQMDLDIDLLGVIPATENLPAGRAYKPGDVIRALNGRTIEVISTDAEGRLILADALAYAKQLGATHLIDVATLTGACVIALGHVASGVMGNDSEFVDAVLNAAEQAGERMWRLPLFPEYRRQLDSKVADIKNVGGRPGGVITGGWFLREFVGDTSWVHIDIAGTAWNEKDEPDMIEGGTGAATRTLIALAERMTGGVQ
jgi:leucyl aminopeptidase